MPVNREIKVIKVPLPDSERMPDYPKAFPPMPQLYLELLENKQKIKQDLINKDYVPVPTGSAPPVTEEYTRRKSSEKEKKKESDSVSSISEDISSDSSSVRNMSSDAPSSSSASSSSSRSSYSSSSSSSESSSASESSDELSNRLKKLLGNESNSSSSKSKSKDKYSEEKKRHSSSGSNYTPYDKYKATAPVPPPPAKQAPTLTELEQKGHFQRDLEYRNITNITASEHEDEDRKRELIFKFDLLKKSYPSSSATIPEYSVHSDLKEMQKAYEDSVKRLSLDSTVSTYKTYLIGGFSVVEFVFGNFLGFDMQGFTQQQIINMNSYERLLIELGEKSYVPTGSSWPVEIRLLGIIVINAGIFIVSKMIMKKTGANLMNMINTMNTPPSGGGAVPKPKRRMKGPNIDLNDIPDITEEEQAK